MGRSAALLASIALASGCYDLARLGDGTDAAVVPTADAGVPVDGDLSDQSAPPDRGGVTGSPCTSVNDCVEPNQPMCLGNQVNPPWPSGYCTGACTVGANGDAGNPDCTGGGYCIPIQVGVNLCVAPCAAPNTCRTGYACFYYGCLPNFVSTCNPEKTLSMTCQQSPTDGGAVSLDAGVAQTVCVPAGIDTMVGYCVPKCDLFAQNCSLGSACVPNPYSGSGGCVKLFPNAGGDGAPCLRAPECSRGHYCDGAVCRRMCNTGGQPVNCLMGQTCTQLGNLPTSTVGLCK